MTLQIHEKSGISHKIFINITGGRTKLLFFFVFLSSNNSTQIKAIIFPTSLLLLNKTNSNLSHEMSEYMKACGWVFPFHKL